MEGRKTPASPPSPKKDVHIFFGTCEYIALHGKRHIANVMRLGLWDGVVIPHYPAGLSLITWVLERQGLFPGAVSEREMWPQKKGQRNGTSLALNMEGGATIQGMWEASRSQKRQGNRLSPRAFKKVCSPANTLILAQKGPFQTSEPQNCKTANLCWVKPLKLW